jgi:hypothetical protein
MGNFLRRPGTAALLAVVALTAFGCHDDGVVEPTGSDHFSKPSFNAPSIQVVSADEHTITLRVTAGASGAPAGFTVQWERRDDWNTHGWASGQYSYCQASFSGNASGNYYALAPGASADVVIGVDDYDIAGASGGCGELSCGTEFAFRGFAHATSSTNRSPFSADLVTGSTTACPSSDCSVGFGYWKTHTDAWPAGHSPSDAFFASGKTWSQMLSLSPAGDKTIILAHDYIETKLNICNGANPVLPTDDMTIVDALTSAEAHFAAVWGGVGTPLSNSDLQTLHNTIESNKSGMGCDGDLTYCP